LAQFPAHVPGGAASLTGFAVASAVTLALFAQLPLILARTPELLALAAATAASEANTARSDLDPLREG
jgi:hypothetical protein